MNISVNGKPYECEQKQQIAALLQRMGYGHGHYAVALNGEYIPRTEYAVTDLREGDTVDIVAPIQGG